MLRSIVRSKVKILVSVSSFPVHRVNLRTSLKLNVVKNDILWPLPFHLAPSIGDWSNLMSYVIPS